METGLHIFVPLGGGGEASGLERADLTGAKGRTFEIFENVQMLT